MDEDYLGFVAGEDVTSHRIDGASGAFEPLDSAETDVDPSFLALGPGGDHLYCVGDDDGQLLTYAVDDDGGLSEVARRSTGDVNPCHVSVDPAGDYLFVAHFTGGSVGLFPLDGAVPGEPVLVDHDAVGPHGNRDEDPHPHSANPAPDGAVVYVPDRGTDHVHVYEVDRKAGALVEGRADHVHVYEGAGPRHFAVHPEGDRAFVINEHGDTITAFERDDDGGLTELATVTTLPEDFDGENATAEVAVHPSGEWVYGSNRGHDSIAVFELDDDRTPVPAGHVDVRGEWPRHFALDPAGEFLFAENKHTDDIVAFDVQGDGSLEPTGHVVDVAAPQCLVLRPV